MSLMFYADIVNSLKTDIVRSPVGTFTLDIIGPFD